MSIEKRRTVWVNDEDWAAFQARAAERKVSPSALLRAWATLTPSAMASAPIVAGPPMLPARSFGHSVAAPKPPRKPR